MAPDSNNKASQQKGLPFQPAPCVALLGKKVQQKFKDATEQLVRYGEETPDLPPNRIDVPNPCLFSNLAEWRDLLRKEYDATAWKADLIQITLTLHLIGGDTQDPQVIFHKDKIFEYEELVELFQSEEIIKATFHLDFAVGGQRNVFECSQLLPAAREYLCFDETEDVKLSADGMGEKQNWEEREAVKGMSEDAGTSVEATTSKYPHGAGDKRSKEFPETIVPANAGEFQEDLDDFSLNYDDPTGAGAEFVRAFLRGEDPSEDLFIAVRDMIHSEATVPPSRPERKLRKEAKGGSDYSYSEEEQSDEGEGEGEEGEDEEENEDDDEADR